MLIFKSIILGTLIFIVDLIAYGHYIFTLPASKEKSELSSKLKYTVPISLFMQIFFALIFVFTFRFLAIFKALTPSLSGGLYFSYIMFLPMLYMFFNNLLWTDSRRSTIYLNILVWGVKLGICGLFTPTI